ncbi:glucosamine-6-phosphate deaminase [Acidobacteriota bacterium]
MRIFIKKNYHEVSIAAADEINQLVEQKPDCVLGLATGLSPLGAYRELILRNKKGLDLSRVTTFNLDEYWGLGMNPHIPYPKDQSYARFMHEEFFNHINIQKERIHLLDGRAPDPDDQCVEYERQITQAGGIDLQLLGIGRTGHLAFNEPGSPFDSRTRIVNLSPETREDNYKLFYKKSGSSREEMPTQAVSMGIGTILEARSLLILATGRDKARIVVKALEGEVTPEVPASIIQIFKGQTTMILDRESASGLINPD